MTKNKDFGFQDLGCERHEPEPGEPNAKVILRGSDTDCASGVCMKGCSHLMWFCDQCTCEGGWGMAEDRLTVIAAEHACPPPPVVQGEPNEPKFQDLGDGVYRVRAKVSAITGKYKTGEPNDDRDAAFEEGMDAIDWGMVRNGEGDPQEAAGIAVRAALVAAQGSAPQAESEELAWYKVAAKHSADSMAEARATLQMFADRVDPFVFDELSSVLDDQPLDYETGWAIGEAAPVLPSSTTPQAEAYDHCCQHPKCPGGSLCCCASEQRLRNAWNQRLSEFDADAKQAFRDGYQAGQNDPAPWMAPVLPSSGVDEDALAEVLREAAEKAWDRCVDEMPIDPDWKNFYGDNNPYRAEAYRVESGRTGGRL